MMSSQLRLSAVALGLVAGLGAMAVPAAVMAKAPIACGSIYAIEPGDTLFKIAERAYSDGHLYDRIYKANRDFLPNEASVEIGDRLLIPCLDDTGPRTRREALARERRPARDHAEAAREAGERTMPAGTAEAGAAAQLSGETQAAESPTPVDRILGLARMAATPGTLAVSSMVSERSPRESGVHLEPGTEAERIAPAESREAPPASRIRFLVSSNSIPYAGETLPHGGMITELMSRAVGAAAPGQAFRVTFVANDRAHLEDLLTDGAFDVGFPWYKPACDRGTALGPDARAQCRDFRFSRPLVELRFGTFVRADASTGDVDDPVDLIGKRVCRAEGRFMSDLGQDGETALSAVIRTEETAETCFLALAQGEVDAVHMVKPDAMATIRSLGMEEHVTEVAALERARMLHAVAPRSNAAGRAYLELINRGLESLMMSGDWFDLVAMHNSVRLADRN